MREILFKGKRTDNGEWVYGDLLHPDLYGNGYSIEDFAKEKNNCFDIIPESISEFTGLTDKNDKKIFEGDIVNILGNQDVADWKNVNYNALIAFIDGGFCAIDGTIEKHGFRRYALARMDFDLEVIGNIHDNPELLNDAEVDEGNE